MAILHDVSMPEGKAVPVKIVEGGAGGGDMEKAIYDTNDDGKVDAAETADNVSWSGITEKPSTFPPSSHSHEISQVSGLQPALDGKAATGHGHVISDITDLQAELDDIKARLDALEGSVE